MQIEQVKDRFSQVEQCIHNAAQTCEQSGDAPDQLRNCLAELEHESHHTRELVEQTQDDGEIKQCVDKMAKIGDRALQVFGGGNYVDDQLQVAVRQARKAISALKQTLH
ncbi:hypothetical protein [Noviherbaspirillum sp. UKPF54]|uniref:hypothetical protein n=1 Tax=Noviherbaspirillum sp. UKPF54 TaxID=2601898 RepID=UPI0011B1A1C7|nr:hypothetical protein [Noviherbaspirillum sp. UKPF54]QDZ27673.1 hypothetical protein FAY22_06705 [Noviherbaspirillum sp. UKPF54]